MTCFRVAASLLDVSRQCASAIRAGVGLCNVAAESLTVSGSACIQRRKVAVNLRSILADRLIFRADHAPFFREALLGFSHHGSANEYDCHIADKSDAGANVDEPVDWTVEREPRIRAFGAASCALRIERGDPVGALPLRHVGGFWKRIEVGWWLRCRVGNLRVVCDGQFVLCAERSVEEDEEEEKSHQHLKSALRKEESSVPKEGRKEGSDALRISPCACRHCAASGFCTRLVSKSQRLTASHRVQ